MAGKDDDITKQMERMEESMRKREEEYRTSLHDLMAKIDQIQNPQKSPQATTTKSHGQYKAQGTQEAHYSQGSQKNNPNPNLEKKPGESRIEAVRRRLLSSKTHEEYRMFIRQIKRETVEDVALSEIYQPIGDQPFRLSSCRFFNVGKCTRPTAHTEGKNSAAIRIHICEICAITRFVGIEHEIVQCPMLRGLDEEFNAHNTDNKDDSAA